METLAKLAAAATTARHRQVQSKDRIIGKLEYSIGKYERLIRATVPIRLFGKKDDQSKFYYLLISFDLKSAIIDIIEDKVMPFVEKNRENLVCVVSQ